MDKGLLVERWELEAGFSLASGLLEGRKRPLLVRCSPSSASFGSIGPLVLQTDFLWPFGRYFEEAATMDYQHIASKLLASGRAAHKTLAPSTMTWIVYTTF